MIKGSVFLSAMFIGLTCAMEQGNSISSSLLDSASSLLYDLEKRCKPTGRKSLEDKADFAGHSFFFDSSEEQAAKNILIDKKMSGNLSLEELMGDYLNPTKFIVPSVNIPYIDPEDNTSNGARELLISDQNYVQQCHEIKKRIIEIIEKYKAHERVRQDNGYQRKPSFGRKHNLEQHTQSINGNEKTINNNMQQEFMVDTAEENVQKNQLFCSKKCGYTNASESHMLSHERAEHRMQCFCSQDKCGKIFMSCGALMQHVEKEHKVSDVCSYDQCGFFSENKWKMRNHQIDSVHETFYKCSCCFNFFSSVDGFRQHNELCKKSLNVAG